MIECNGVLYFRRLISDQRKVLYVKNRVSIGCFVAMYGDFFAGGMLELQIRMYSRRRQDPQRPLVANLTWGKTWIFSSETYVNHMFSTVSNKFYWSESV